MAKEVDWMTKVKVTFNQMEEKKLKKINISNIFKVTIDKNVQPIFTTRQKDWIKEGVGKIEKGEQKNNDSPQKPSLFSGQK